MHLRSRYLRGGVHPPAHVQAAKAAIRDALLPLIELQGIILPGKRRYRRVFDLYVRLNISFADAFHAVLMGQLKITDVMSFDAEFDRVPGITRREP